MRLASIQLARYYGLVQIEDLNLNGTVYYPELFAGLVERYGFIKYPTVGAVVDDDKGLEFIGGKSGKHVIDKLVIIGSGVYLDTTINTAASQMLWLGMMEWAVEKFGITFKREMVKRAAYVSTVTFHSDVPMLAANPIFAEIGAVASAEVEKNFKQPLIYEPVAINIAFDKLSTKIGTAPFTVQRREGVPFEENKYFSTAPLKTEIHLELLEKWEKAMSH